jgi:hypothetical protein
VAKAAMLGLSTVKKFESDRRETTAANMVATRRALEAAGVEFILTRNGKSVGVRLREYT